MTFQFYVNGIKPPLGDGMSKAVYDPTKEEKDIFDSGNINYDNTISGLVSTNVKEAINEIDNILDNITDPLLFKGVINVNSDFPTLADVKNGWFYTIRTDVTDDDATKTNTGQSFLVGEEIAWNGSDWTKIGSDKAESVSYDNSISELTAINVQDAIDETINALTLKASSTHTHGEITNDGKITTNVTIASTDRILISDTSDANKIKGGVAFGTSTTTYLRNDGTFATPPDTNTTYSEITESEITAGTASTLRTITGRRAKFIADRNVGTANPLMNGTVAVGTSLLYSRQDHVHASDTGKANTNQTMYIGTTAVEINRASATLNLSGIGTLSCGTITSSGDLSIGTTNSITCGTLQIGDASDTAITRVSGGIIAIEGVNVVTTSSSDTLINKTLSSPTLTTPVLGTPQSGNLTNCTFPTLNQSTTGSANSLKSPTTTGLMTVTGMTTGTTRAKTVRDADDTILELGGSYTPTGTFTSMKLNENVSLTTTSTKLNYLTNATGTTGTNTTNIVFSTSPSIITPTFTTSITTPLIIGGTSTTQSLIYKTTTGVGTTNSDHIFQVGNNGATEAMRILHNGLVRVSGSLALKSTTLSVSTSLNNTHNKVYCNNAGAITITLPNATTYPDIIYSISNINTGSTVINTVSSQTINGSTSRTITGIYGTITLQAVGSQWIILTTNAYGG